jgi:Tol biopolymer transport system component
LWIVGLAWTRDGHSIVWGGAGDSQLWRVDADGGTPPEPVDLAGTGARAPSTARGQDRLAFTRYRWAPDVYRLPLDGSPTPLIESTAVDWFPQYSPDGRRIVFESGRTGAEEIWLAEASGSNSTRLTHGPGRHQGSPSWSPDGRTVAFDSRGQDGHWDIWTIGVDGSGLRQVTRNPADENMPSFSRDGRFLYFSSNRTGHDEVWRIAVAGGAEEQVTREGGCIPFESLDGRTLYYMRRCQHDALLARPSGGGKERTIVGCVNGKEYAVTSRGVFYVGCETEGGPTGALWTLRFRDTASGEDRPVASLAAAWLGGVSVSPDGQTVIYGRGIQGFDLVMIENFR